MLEKEIKEILLKHSFPPDKDWNASLGCPYILLEERLTDELIQEIEKLLKAKMQGRVLYMNGYADCKQEILEKLPKEKHLMGVLGDEDFQLDCGYNTCLKEVKQIIKEL